MSVQMLIETLDDVPVQRVGEAMEDFNAVGAQAAVCTRQKNGAFSIRALFTRAAQELDFDISTPDPQARVHTFTGVPADQIGTLVQNLHYEGGKASYYKLQGDGKYSVSSVTAIAPVAVNPRC